MPKTNTTLLKTIVLLAIIATINSNCSNDQYCKTCSGSACTECHNGFVYTNSKCVFGATAYCESYTFSSSTCKCCEYPMYYNGSKFFYF